MPREYDDDDDGDAIDVDGNLLPVRRRRPRQPKESEPERPEQRGHALARRRPALRVVPDAIYEIYEPGMAPIERRQPSAPARRDGGLTRRRRKALPARQKLRRALTAGLGAAAATLVPGGAMPDELKAAAGGAAGALADRLLGLLAPEPPRWDERDDGDYD